MFLHGPVGVLLSHDSGGPTVFPSAFQAVLELSVGALAAKVSFDTVAVSLRVSVQLTFVVTIFVSLRTSETNTSIVLVVEDFAILRDQLALAVSLCLYKFAGVADPTLIPVGSLD